MFQPGRETNIPTSSGTLGGGTLQTKLFSVDGFTMTLGLLILVVAAIWLWSMFAKKR